MNWQHGATRGTIDATSVRHVTSTLGFKSNIGYKNIRSFCASYRRIFISIRKEAENCWYVLVVSELPMTSPFRFH